MMERSGQQYNNTPENTRPDQETGEWNIPEAEQAAARKQRAYDPGSSGQQSTYASGQNSNSGFSQPESWNTTGNQGPANTGNTQGGFNNSNYNQEGTYSESQGQSQQRQDGYAETQGRGYGSSADTPYTSSQQDVDPARSGVQPAQNRPGERINAPGRETGNSWEETQQNGYTTDTPDRRNPAQ